MAIRNLVDPPAVFTAMLWRKYWKLLALGAIPLIFLVQFHVIHQNLGKIFMGHTDPEYFYLYNGVMIGNGNFSVQYTSNPGTPLMFLVAISSRMAHSVQPGDYLRDVVGDPEKYIHSARLLLTVLIALALFAGARYLYFKSHSVTAAWLFQAGILASSSLLSLGGRLNAEAMLVLPMILMIYPVSRYIFSEQDNQEVSGTTLALFGFIIGFGMAVKITFFAFLLIPLILIRGTFRQKLRLLLYTFISFAVFGYPVVFNNGDFWNWIIKVMTHTGKYGQGTGGFIDLTLLPGNFNRLLTNDPGFIILTVIALIVGLLFSARSLNHRFNEHLKRLNRALVGVSVAIILAMFLVLKHFELYYFAPFYFLKFWFLSISVLMIRQFLYGKLVKSINRTATGIVILASLFILYNEIPRIRSSNQYYIEKSAEQDREYLQINSLVEPGNPVLIAGRYYGTPFIEFAHYEGFKMSGHLKKSFIPHLKEMFPVSYQFVPWSDKFYYWDGQVTFQDILAQTTRYWYVFIGEKRQDDLPVIEDRFWNVISEDKILKEIIYKNPSNGDLLIRYSRRPVRPQTS